ncbi:MAG TPA: hypothetical protein VGP06_13385 [Janthinobacterium sp.]|nr:hypothetical protein [Janthinobacterium sp.]
MKIRVERRPMQADLLNHQQGQQRGSDKAHKKRKHYFLSMQKYSSRAGIIRLARQANRGGLPSLSVWQAPIVPELHPLLSNGYKQNIKTAPSKCLISHLY